MQDHKQWLRSLIVDYMETDANRMGDNFGDEKMWDTPLVAFASGADELFKKYKSVEVCGVEHWTPAEAFAKAYPDSSFQEDELTVVSWVLPQTEKSKASLRAETHWPSERWSRARVIGEVINEVLRDHVIKTIRAAGYEAMAPVMHPEWTRLETPRQVFTSKWSERHAAHAAGLGTFGLCDALITPVGKAHRLGSIIIKLKVEPDQRPYTDIHEYCLHYTKGTCMACVKRCTPGALTANGHDKQKCRAFLRGPATDYVKEKFGLDGYGCGMCQTAVPCENGIPLK